MGIEPSTTKPLLLGLRPRRQDDPRNVPLQGTASGSRIEKLSGVAPGELLSVYDTVNLFYRFEDRVVDTARLKSAIENRVVVCLGAEAHRAAVACGCALVCVRIPHPSGLNRAWNDPQTTINAARVLEFSKLLCTNLAATVYSCHHERY